MTNETDEPLFSDDADDSRDEAMRVLLGRGLRAAVTAAIEVCENSEAPAPARATAAGWIFRTTGLTDAKPAEEKAPHEMSAAELATAAANARAKLANLGSTRPARSSARMRKQGDVFD